MGKKKTKRKDSRKVTSPSDQLTTPDEQEKESDWRNPELAEESESALPLFSVPKTKVAPSEESAKRLGRSQPKTEAGVNGSNKKKQNRPKKKGGPIEEKSVKTVSDRDTLKDRIPATPTSAFPETSDPP